MLRTICPCTVLAVICVVASNASADGCMMPRKIGESTVMVASPKQEAVLATDGKTVQIVLRTHFRAGPEELAWIVPVPARPTKIEKCGDEIFSVLERQTAPRFYQMADKGGGFGCHCAAAPAGRAAAGLSAVIVEETGTAGIFKYVVLSATKADELTRWLNDNKYFVPIGAERLFDRYVKAGWHWLAMRVRPEAAGEKVLAPHPISYTYRDERLVYPLVISQLSADLRNEIVLYVVGDCRCACANWANATIDRDRVKVKPAAPSGTNYEELLTGLSEKHRGRVFVTEFAQRRAMFGSAAAGRSREIDDVLDREFIDSWDSRQSITRLRAIMTPKAMDRDVVLVPVAGWQSVENHYTLASNDPPTVPLAATCGVIFAAVTGLRLMGRPDGGRAGPAGEARSRMR